MDKVIEFPRVRPEAGALPLSGQAEARTCKSTAAPSAVGLDMMAAEERIRQQTAAEMEAKALTRFLRRTLVALVIFWTTVGWLIVRALR